MDMHNNITNITGVIPAAGLATRLPKLPCSKEIFPIGVNIRGDDSEGNIEIASASLLNHLSAAGANKAYMIIRKEKWDIPSLLEDGSDYNINLSYIVTPPTSSTVYSIAKSLPFIRHDIVLLGFPDIQISDPNPFSILLKKLNTPEVDVVLGLFETENPKKVDMVELNADGSLKRIEIKPKHTRLSLTWLIAAWKPTFTREIEGSLTDLKSSITSREIYLGDIIYKSIEKGCTVQTHTFSNTGFIDIGTLPDLKRVIGQPSLK